MSNPRILAAAAAPASAASDRKVARAFAAEFMRQGAGVRNLVAVGGRDLPDLDPFLVVAEFGGDEPDDYVGGFPDHPHRGFETCTYVVDGRVRHGDSRGNDGRLGPGGVQWMTAGRGLLHSEMADQASGRLRAFQLWINLPAAEKMREPRYQDIAAERVPAFAHEGVRGKVLVGSAFGLSNPVETTATQPLLIDLAFTQAAAIAVPLPPAHAALVFVYEGSARVAGWDASQHTVAVLTPGERVVLGADGPARLLVVAGKPIGEPIAKGGPFVMNTPAEIEQAFADYRAGRLA